MVPGTIFRNGGTATAAAAVALTLAPFYRDSYSIRKPIFHHSLGVRVGDILQFYNFNTGQVLASRLVVSIREASDENPTVGVVLDAAIGPGLVTTYLPTYLPTTPFHDMLYVPSLLIYGSILSDLLTDWRTD